MIDFVQFCFLGGVYSGHILTRLFALTFDFRVKKWCYSLPIDSISLFKQLVNELHHVLDKCEYQDVINEINQIGMELNESLEQYAK